MEQQQRFLSLPANPCNFLQKACNRGCRCPAKFLPKACNRICCCPANFPLKACNRVCCCPANFSLNTSQKGVWAPTAAMGHPGQTTRRSLSPLVKKTASGLLHRVLQSITPRCDPSGTMTRDPGVSSDHRAAPRYACRAVSIYLHSTLRWPHGTLQHLHSGCWTLSHFVAGWPLLRLRRARGRDFTG